MTGIGENLGFLLAQVTRAHQDHVRRSLRETGLHRGQPTLLVVLDEQDGSAHSEIASRMGVTPPTISTMVKRMERAGFVVRRRDTADDRVSRVYLTDAGRSIYSQLEPITQKMDEGTFAGFTEEEQTLMRGLLDRVRANLHQLKAEGEPG